ncbi:MAG: hypothetical protein JXA90_14555 [Planctomycetes bacterium]|nr:hypothetical protein [Planctomycetota bacterium]
MRRLLVCITALLPASAWAQYIGHPAGSLLPASRSDDSTSDARRTVDLGGAEMGITGDWPIEADYTTLLGARGERTSTFSEVYGAVSRGANMPVSSIGNFQLAGKVGGVAHKIKEHDIGELYPFDHSGGFLLGLDGRAGISPISPLRFGLGFQVTGTYSTDVFDGGFTNKLEDAIKEEIFDDILDYHEKNWYSDADTRELWLLRTQLFLGGGVDIPISKRVVLSPYGGAGLNLAFGELQLVEDYMSCDSETHSIATIREDRLGIYFGGLDVNITLGEESSPRTFVLRLEGQTDGEGWLAGISLQFPLGRPSPDTAPRRRRESAMAAPDRAVPEGDSVAPEENLLEDVDLEDDQLEDGQLDE